MSIKKLPEYLINKLKAGEIVERPVSVVKELIENALDAHSTKIGIEIVDGGKKLIKITDNGTGIPSEDIDLVLERYATSKITSEEDLFNIHTYGFRGEALASIAEVSKCTLQTKTEDNPIAIQSSKINGQVLFTKIPFINPHGTTVIVEDLFFNTPARLKFLKSEQTEYVYIYQLFVDYVLVHRDKSRSLKKNGHMVFDLPATGSLLERFAQMYKADWVKNVKTIEGQSGGGVQLTGLAGDSALSFGSAENIKLYVNHRPVQDRILKKALMTAYERQIKPGEYPLCILFLQIHPDLVDVNVHPRKSEVKFLDPNAVFQYTLHTLGKLFGTHKIIGESQVSASGEYTSSFGSFHGTRYSQNTIDKPESTSFFQPQDLNYLHQNKLDQGDGAQQSEESQQQPYHLVGQLRDSYIVLQSSDGLYYIDQHALAERILFEQLKKKLISDKLKPTPLLQPITFQVGRDQIIEEKIEKINTQRGFEITPLTQSSIIIYSVPQVFQEIPIDLEKIFSILLYQETINMDALLDEIRATKACKAAIKAGEKLSYIQMQELIKQGFHHIPGMFVCQHGRPFFVKIEKKEIDKLFNRT